jgi:hypothetical protein
MVSFARSGPVGFRVAGQYQAQGHGWKAFM